MDNSLDNLLWYLVLCPMPNRKGITSMNDILQIIKDSIYTLLGMIMLYQVVKMIMGIL